MSWPAEFARFPKEWRVLPFLDAITDATAGNPKIKVEDYLESGLLPIVDQGQEQFNGYTNDPQLACDTKLPAIVFGDHTRRFKFIEEPFALGADGAKLLKPKVKFDPKFLYYYLNQLKIESAGYSRHYKFLKETFVPVPPLETQKHIARVLEQADQLRKQAQQMESELNQLAQSLFLEMFGDPIENQKGWKKEPLQNLMTIKRGGSPRPIEKFVGGTIPWIKIGDATSGDDIYIHETKERIIEEGLSKTVFLEPGSVIFANCGVSLGFARILKIAGCIHDGWLSFSEIDEDRINKVFLLKAINSITEHFRRIAPDGTQPNLNTGLMKSFEMIVPPIELQNSFEKLVFEIVERKREVKDNIEHFDKLFHSLMQRAFKGELTTPGSKAA